MFIGAGILHVFVRLLGGTQGFEATFRIVCYAQAPAIVTAIPCIGPYLGFLAGIYACVLEGLGIYRVHEMTPGKAVLAVLAPVILSLILVGIVIAVIVFGVIAAEGTV